MTSLWHVCVCMMEDDQIAACEWICGWNLLSKTYFSFECRLTMFLLQDVDTWSCCQPLWARADVVWSFCCHALAIETLHHPEQKKCHYPHRLRLGLFCLLRLHISSSVISDPNTGLKWLQGCWETHQHDFQSVLRWMDTIVYANQRAVQCIL